MEHPDAADQHLSRLECRDEVLQVLFWLKGEGFEREMTPEGVARFVVWPEAEVRAALKESVRIGLSVEQVEADAVRYELTEEGRREGGRRFVEEFAGNFALDSHGGTCTDPDCDCHHSPDPAAFCGHHRHGHGKGGHP